MRRRKRDREKDANAWPQDLSEQVRQATQALLAKESLSQAITEGHRVITDVILSAAEVNKQVILGHRKQAQDAREAMEQARATVLALGASAADIREAAMFATAVESLTRTTKTVIELERKSFGIDDAAPAGPTQFDRIERVIIDPQD